MERGAPATALFARTMLVRTRAWTAIPVRLGLAMVLFLVVLAQESDRAAASSAAGLRLLGSTAMTMTVVLTLIGLGWFASAITEEKQDEDFGLLLLTGASAAGILLAKGAARLWEMLLLLAIALPLLLLAVTLGGVGAVQVMAVLIAVASWLTLLAGLGLWCSVVRSDTRRASSLMLVCVFFILLVGGCLDAWHCWGVSIFGRLVGILATGYGGSIVGPGDALNLVLGVCFALLAWRRWGLVIEQVLLRSSGGALEVEGMLPPLEGQVTVVMPGGGPLMIMPMRPELRPPAGLAAVAWKDFHVHCGGADLRRGMTMLLVPICLVMAVILSGTFGLRQALGRSLLLIGLAAIAISSVEQIGHIFWMECRERTIDGLLLLPYPRSRIFLAKVLSLPLTWWPVLILVGMGVIVAPDFVVTQVCIGFFGSVDGWALASWYAFLLSLTLAFSLLMRRGAALLALVLGLVVLGVGGAVLGSGGLLLFACLLACGLLSWFSLRRFTQGDAGR